jgi:general L-amino acid transport system permease protein
MAEYPEKKEGRFSRAIKWLKENLFYNIWSTLITIFCLYFVIGLFIPFFQWLVVDSVWTGTAAVCRKADGACFPFIKEKARYILLGRYPYAEHWRPILNIVIYLCLLIFSRNRERWGKKLLVTWFGFGIISFIIMKGGIFGLPLVETENGRVFRLLSCWPRSPLSFPILWVFYWR